MRVDQITGVRFERGPYLFPSFPGQEGLGVEFLGPGEDMFSAAACPTCMTASGCGRRSWRSGRRCASATATVTSRGSTEALSGPTRLNHRARADARHTRAMPGGDLWSLAVTQRRYKALDLGTSRSVATISDS